ncbi:MAG: CDP-alcohol phosphatidyltransferase family protein [Burkholderiaceae bacterium]|nr:CDP-alcohol phosphatidyltransferase family protein [Burkholderiaceae bacterium]
MLNLPNAITVGRLLLVPAIGWLAYVRDYDGALWLLLLAAASDALDGLLARAWNQRTRFGAMADPLADKATMLVVTLLLAWQELLPWWLAAAIVGRDLLIVTGALAYRLVIGHLEVTPTRLSKLNTALEFTLLAAVLAQAAGLVEIELYLAPLFWITLGTVLASGAQYIWLWGIKAVRHGRPA